MCPPANIITPIPISGRSGSTARMISAHKTPAEDSLNFISTLFVQDSSSHATFLFFFVRKGKQFFGMPFRGMEGAVTECALYAGLSVDFVKDLPAAGELVERFWQECIAAHNITGGTAPRFRKRSKNGRIRH